MDFVENLSSLKVLVVDDAPENHVLVTRTLERYGAHVDSARDGLEGVTMAIRDDYDMILMDIQMPVLDGVTATCHLRRCGFRGPIVACTSLDLQRDENGRLEVEVFDDCMRKPIDTRALVRRMQRLQLLKLVRGEVVP